MCRFATIISENAIQPATLLDAFADMAKNSPAPDGDMQKDGWGIAWIDVKGMWQVYRSLRSVWDDVTSFQTIPKSNAFAIHARSASFPQHRGIIEFNQPYVNSEYAFVFNGLLRGVSLPDIPGRIGAEKIWNILQNELKTNDPQTALQNVKTLLILHTEKIIALNLGLMNRNEMYSLNYFTGDPAYYTLHTQKVSGLRIISSQPLALFSGNKKYLSIEG